MMKRAGDAVQFELPMTGGRAFEQLRHLPTDEVLSMVETPEGQRIVEETAEVMLNRPRLAFLHTALCSMSLPVRRPKGDEEFKPIIRKDGNYTLMIVPVEQMRMVDGELKTVKLGVPYGIHARLVMLFIMTEAVRNRSKEIFLGDSFAAWMRRIGITSTNSGGPRGSRALLQVQVERLMSCQWTIRWDHSPQSAAAEQRKKGKRKEPVSMTPFAAERMDMVKQYGGVTTGEGQFATRFTLSDEFYENLIAHAAPLNERAFAALKNSATQIDLYTYLVQRLHRIPEGQEIRLPWAELARNLGNETTVMTKFRQTVRKAWAHVSGVYQQAAGAVSFDSDRYVLMRRADPPIKNHTMKHPDGRLELITLSPKSADEGTVDQEKLEASVQFPADGNIRYHNELSRIAREYGGGRCIDALGSDFAKILKREGVLETCVGQRLLKRFEAFCVAQKPV